MGCGSGFGSGALGGSQTGIPRGNSAAVATTNVWTRVLVDFQQKGPVHEMHVEFWDLK